MKKHLIPVLALTLCVALVGAGCGGDDDETTTETTTAATGATGATGESGGGLLPDDFAAEADAICTAGDAEIDAEAEKFFGDLKKEPTEAELEEFATTIPIPGIQEQIDELSALGEPDEGADEWNTFLDDAQTTLDEVKDDPIVLTNEEENPFADVERQAQELGLAQCASDDREEEEEEEGGASEEG